MKKLLSTGNTTRKVGIENFKSTLSRELFRAFGKPDIMSNMYGFDIDGLESILIRGYSKGALVSLLFRDGFYVDVPDALSKYRVKGTEKYNYDLYIDERDVIELLIEHIVKFLDICQLENDYFTLGREYYDEKDNAYRLISIQFHKEYKSAYCTFLTLETGKEWEGWWKGPGYPIENDKGAPIAQLYYMTDGCFKGSSINIEKKYLKRKIYGVDDVNDYKQKLKNEMLKAFGKAGLIILMCSWRTEKPLIIGVQGTDNGVGVSCRFSFGKIMGNHDVNNNWISVENKEQIDEAVDKIIVTINELIEMGSYYVLGGIYADSYSSNIYRLTTWRVQNDHRVWFTFVDVNTGEEREGWGEAMSDPIVDDDGLSIMFNTHRIDN